MSRSSAVLALQGRELAYVLKYRLKSNEYKLLLQSAVLATPLLLPLPRLLLLHHLLALLLLHILLFIHTSSSSSPEHGHAYVARGLMSLQHHNMKTSGVTKTR